MSWDEPRPPRKTTLTLGDDLAVLSVEELAERIDLLNAEIARHESEIARKQDHLAAASSIFRK